MPTPRLLSRFMFAACLAFGTASALAAPPSDADVERLLKASRAESMLNAILPQMEQMQRQQFEQITGGKDLSAEQKAEVERIQSRTNEIVRKALAWEEMRPLYIDVYKQTFSAADVKAMAKFYESPAGRSLLEKTPALTQNLMGAIQKKVIPMMEELQAELKESTKETPAPEVTPPSKKKKKG